MKNAEKIESSWDCTTKHKYRRNKTKKQQILHITKHWTLSLSPHKYFCAVSFLCFPWYVSLLMLLEKEKKTNECEPIYRAV